MNKGSPETVLISRLKEGDKDALKQVFDEHFASLCRIAYRVVHDTDVAKDMVQDVFVKLWINRAQLTIRSSLTAYLRRAVVNTSINHANSKHTAVMTLTGDEVIPSDSPDVVQLAQLEAAAEKAIQNLPPRTRAVFTLTRFENFSYLEVADHLGISEKAVEKEMMKALKLLRTALQRFLALAIASEYFF